MRKLVTIHAALAAALLMNMGVESKADSWCASYHEGAMGCGFVSQEQCQEQVRGIGGLCIRN